MIVHTHRVFVPESASLLMHKESPSGYQLHADIVFMTEQFREFQMTVIEEALAQITDMLFADSMLFDDVVQATEEILQNTNEKLVSFADKMTSVQSFDIRWMITLTQHANFVSAVIGDVSMVLVRKWRVSYTMQNDSDIRQKISLFSDIVEWDIHRDDKVYFFGTHIDAILDRDDMDDIVARSQNADNEQLVQAWEEALHARMSLSDIGLILQYSLEMWSVYTAAKWFSLPLPAGLKNFGESVKYTFDTTLLRLWQKVKNKQFILLASLVGVFIIFVLWSIIHGWVRNTTTQTINADGTTTAALSIEDIKKEIAAFQKLDPTSDEKGVKYNTIIKELQRIQQEGKWVNDVQQLKKILDTEYLQWFNIILFDSLQDQLVYTFSSLEQSTLGKPLQVFFQKWLYVAGKQWSLLSAISNDIRGTVVRSVVNDDFATCNMNLLKNGLYCATTKNTLFHMSKAGAESLGGEDILFPWSIVGLATFGSANFYVLTQDASYNKEKTYIVRYTNVLWSQNTFGGAMNLPLWPSANETEFGQWFSSIAIDGSFLLWSKDQKTLYQFYRNPQDKTLTSRAIPMKWWLTLWKGFSDDIKVITTPGTRYVYLYDRVNHTLSAYISAPAKNNDAFANNYWLEYVMRLDFSHLAAAPYDVTVDESDGKQTAFVLTDAGIAKVPMSDLLETLKKTRVTQQ